jgi:hypothetical protein
MVVHAPRLRELLATMLLLAATTFGWLTGTGTWNASAWAEPAAYMDVQKSDIIGLLATIRAVADGNYAPTRPKIVPELGAPDAANWNDIPVIEEIPIYLAGVLARFTGIFAALNIKLLIGHLLAALCFYGVARYYKCQIAWAWAGGLAFGLAPFIFAQSPHHSVVAYVWHIPLFLVVWDWVSTEPGIRPWSGRFWVAICVGVLTSLQNIYYTNVFCQLVLLGGVVLFFQNRSRPIPGSIAWSLGQMPGRSVHGENGGKIAQGRHGFPTAHHGVSRSPGPGSPALRPLPALPL